MLSGPREDSDEDTGRPQRTRISTHPNGYSGYGIDDFDDASENEANSSGNEWHSGDDGDEHDFEGDDEDEEDVSGDESVLNEEPPSLVVQLRYGAPGAPKVLVDKPPPAQDVQMKGAEEMRPPVGDSSTHIPPTFLPSSNPQPALNNSSEIPRQGPAMTAPTMPAPVVNQQGLSTMPFIPTPVAPTAEVPKTAASAGLHVPQTTGPTAGGNANPDFVQARHFQGCNPTT